MERKLHSPMHLSADEVYADPKRDDCPSTVGFHDHTADYCVILSRFSDLEPDDGTIEVMVLDQIWARTANLEVNISPNECRVRLDAVTAAKLLGVREYIIDFSVDADQFALMVKLLRELFDGLSGLTVHNGASEV